MSPSPRFRESKYLNAVEGVVGRATSLATVIVTQSEVTWPEVVVKEL